MRRPSERQLRLVHCERPDHQYDGRQQPPVQHGFLDHMRRQRHARIGMSERRNVRLLLRLAAAALEPIVEKFKNVELPASASAKVCIDDTGKVTLAQMVSKLDHRVAADIEEMVRGWKYAPYHANGMAIPACFMVAFKLK